MDEARVCLAQPGLASLQIIFNLFRQKPIDALFADALAKQVALIVRLPLASGLLSGKMTTATTFPADDHRNYNRDGAAFNVGKTFAGLPFDKGIELTDALRAFVPEGLSFADFSQRWILDHPAVTTVITGASRPDQATRNARVSDLPPLAPELHARLRDFYASEVAAHIRGPY
jgi:aryl-alcohol dehydrogenase-like predicted oxidoreductase